MPDISDLSLIPNIKILTDAYLYHQEGIVNSILNRFKGHIDRLAVDDIFSNVFIDSCDKVRNGTLDLEASQETIKGYLYKGCYFQACKKTGRDKEDRMPLRKKGEDAGTVDDGKLMQLMGIVNGFEGGDDVINACDEAECKHALSIAIEKLKEPCKKILIDHYWNGFKYKLIAEELDSNEGAVKKQANDCKKRFINTNKHLLEICRK